jgi:hypothetical protein
MRQDGIVQAVFSDYTAGWMAGSGEPITAAFATLTTSHQRVVQLAPPHRSGPGQTAGRSLVPAPEGQSGIDRAGSTKRTWQVALHEPPCTTQTASCARWCKREPACSTRAWYPHATQRAQADCTMMGLAQSPAERTLTGRRGRLVGVCTAGGERRVSHRNTRTRE